MRSHPCYGDDATRRPEERRSIFHIKRDTTWEVVSGNSYVVAYDWERDLPIARLHQSEADAYHIVAFSLVEVLNDVFLSGARNQRVNGRGHR
jgi:hypothetical protein